jgi:hypothetical protein
VRAKGKSERQDQAQRDDRAPTVALADRAQAARHP